MGLATYKQIRFLPLPGTFGNFTLVINRPGNNDLTLPATDTLLLSEGSPEDYYPFLIDGDIGLSKKFVTSRGRRAFDDLTIPIRDGLGYTGTVNGSNVSENFLSVYQTFFDVWFNDTLPYKAFLLYHDALTDNHEVPHEGWIDPSYKPSSDAYVINPLTTNQIWIGTRTLKITAFSQAQTNLTFGDVLTTIGPSDCQEGLPYNGFMLSPPGAEGQNNTQQTAFGGGLGSWYQAVPHWHLYNRTASGNYLVRPPAAVWPATPWVSATAPSQIVPTTSSNLLGIVLGAHGTGYSPGDTGTINGGSTLATYIVTGVGGGGSVITVELAFGGAGYSLGPATTTATTGSGTGLQISIDKLSTGILWGPSGLVFISIGTLFAKIAMLLGQSTFTPSTDLKSALSFWAQKQNTASGQQCFPIDTSGAIALDSIYISLNVFAKSHPYDGSLWDNPVGFDATTSITDVLSALCNFLLVNYNETYASDGTSSLALSPMGQTANAIPSDWIVVGSPTEDEPETAARMVNVKYRADDLTIQAPLGIVGESSEIEIPIRLHRIGQTSGVNPVQDLECVTWDGNDPTTQADECFKIAWFDANNNAAINPNCWKGLCYAYWFNASNTNVVYPSNWNAFPNTGGTAGSWANSFYVVNACYRSGDTPSANLLGEIQGNSFFNARDYPAVAFAALTLPLPTAQNFEFFGIADSSGSIQAIAPGFGQAWRYGAIASQNWIGVEINQTLLAGGTAVKFQAVASSNGFPQIADITHGPISGGGTSSTTGGNTQTGGVTIPPQIAWNIITPTAITTNTNDWAIGQTSLTIAYISSTSDVNVTGITGGISGAFLILINKGSHFVTLVSQSGSSATNQFLFGGEGANPIIGLAPNGSLELLYDSMTSKWRVLSTQ